MTTSQDKTCNQCGEVIPFTLPILPGGRSRMYCSRKCSRKHVRLNRKTYHGTCKHCSTAFSSPHKGREFCSAACSNAINGGIKECPGCGNEFKPQPKYHWLRYCSRPCHETHRRTIGQAVSDERKAQRLAVRACLECSESFAPSRANRYICSPACMRSRSNRKAMESFFRGFTPSPRATKTCAECGSGFTTHLSRQRFCSEACEVKQSKRTASHKRRMRLSGAVCELFSARSIFRRDKWKCALCGKKVNKLLGHRHPMSASLDHIIPLSRGGSHTKANVQCAHLSCNGKKGNRGTTEQLLLIG